MVVGEDVAVLAQHEAGPGGGRLHRLAVKVVPGGGGGADGHDAVDIGRVDLRVAHGGFPVYIPQGHLGHGAVGNVDLALVPSGLGHGPHGPAPRRAAKQGAAQSQGGDLQAQAVFLHRLHLKFGPLGAGLSAGADGFPLVGEFAAVLAVGVVVQVVFIVIHNQLPPSLCIPFFRSLEAKITGNCVERVNWDCLDFKFWSAALSERPFLDLMGLV